MTTRTADRLKALSYILSDGLSYSWFQVDSINEDACKAVVRVDGPDDEEGDMTLNWRVGPDDVARGLRMVREYAEGKRELYNGEWKYYLDKDPNWLPVRAGKDSYLWELVKFDDTNGEDGDYDANTADMVMQFAILGEVRYG